MPSRTGGTGFTNNERRLNVYDLQEHSRKLSAELEELKAKTADIVLRADAPIDEAHRVIETLHREIDEVQFVLETIQCGSVFD